jgi:hypothetical protein
MFIFTRILQKASFLRALVKINNPADAGFVKTLRREGDSNPRYSFPYGSLANCWFKPLTHLSNKIKNYIIAAVYPPDGGWFKPLTHLSNKIIQSIRLRSPQLYLGKVTLIIQYSISPLQGATKVGKQV